MNDVHDPAPDVVSFSTRKAASTAEPTGKSQRFPLVKFDDVFVTERALLSRQQPDSARRPRRHLGSSKVRQELLDL